MYIDEAASVAFLRLILIGYILKLDIKNLANSAILI